MIKWARCSELLGVAVVNDILVLIHFNKSLGCIENNNWVVPGVEQYGAQSDPYLEWSVSKTTSCIHEPCDCLRNRCYFEVGFYWTAVGVED